MQIRDVLFEFRPQHSSSVSVTTLLKGGDAFHFAIAHEYARGEGEVTSGVPEPAAERTL
jgi:hypothetical protein